mmetsp:Transcript_35563/g.82595  ORF Transcript_35563/g.82595 Transcript_35563/m.82595 type:complete len:540 (-) Transcript_35563:514-2133(-)
MRKPKRPHRVLLELSSDESDLSDDSDVVDELENMGGFEPSFMAHDELLKTRRRPIPAAGSKNRVRIHENANDREDRDNSVPEIIQKLGFCCAICTCSISEQEEKLPEGKEGMVHWWVQAEDGGCWHRRCCHGAYTLDETWCPAHDNTLHECLDGTGQKDNANTLEWVTHDEIQRCYNTSKRQEAALYNADGMVHPLELLRTSDDYARIVKGFQAIKKKQKQKYGAVVLEAFAGVGTGTVALKRLGIKIQKVIYVEHDKVSTHVYRSNHDCSYNADLVQSGNIEHVYKYVTFEDLEKDFKQVLKDHGPIDIVLGGPPCIDYSKVNARRQGHMGEQGTYMLRFGQLIRKIEKYQETKYDRPHPLFFLAENVFLSGDDLFAVRDAFQFNFDPVALDAMYLSPCRRNRHYFTNIPLQNLDFTALSSTQGPEKCLEDGYFVPAHIVDAESCAKAQCFMASKTRIDERSSLRMYVFHQSPNKKKQKNKKILQYRGRPMTIVERERMMGYPEGYIEKPGVFLLISKYCCLSTESIINIFFCYRSTS